METKSIGMITQEQLLEERLETAIKRQQMRNFAIGILIIVIVAMFFSNLNASNGSNLQAAGGGYQQAGSNGQQVGYSTGQGGASGGAQGGGGGAGGCCGAGGSAPLPSPEEAKKKALEYYYKKYKDKDVRAEVQDLGCHQQINIYKGSKVVKAISLRGGKISEVF